MNCNLRLHKPDTIHCILPRDHVNTSHHIRQRLLLIEQHLLSQGLNPLLRANTISFPSCPAVTTTAASPRAAQTPDSVYRHLRPALLSTEEDQKPRHGDQVAETTRNNQDHCVCGRRHSAFYGCGVASTKRTTCSHSETTPIVGGCAPLDPSQWPLPVSA